MTHTVKSGDTLSKVARAHGITLAQLLDANPTFKPNPNRVRVGDVLNIPDGSTIPAGPPPATGRVLGKLSEKFEVGRRGPGTVSTGRGDRGGVSYGSFQMTSKPAGGTVKTFVSHRDFPFRDRFAGLTPGSGPFTAAWKALASSHPDAFQSAQHDFIKRTHFDPFVQKIIRDDRLDVLTRSHALQDVIWSTAVQHGPGNDVVHKALGAVGLGPEESGFDRALIVAVYAERGRKNSRGALARFSGNSPAVQKGVAKRFVDEQKDALAMLDAETSG